MTSKPHSELSPVSREALEANLQSTHANLNFCIEQRQRLEEQLEAERARVKFCPYCAGGVVDVIEGPCPGCQRAQRFEEQFDVLFQAATKAWALLPVGYQAHEILGDALLRGSNPASRQDR